MRNLKVIHKELTKKQDYVKRLKTQLKERRGSSIENELKEIV